MIIEAIRKPLKYRWSGGEICFIPGNPVIVDPKLGQRIVQKCGEKVKIIDSIPFKVGDTVTYRVPVIKHATSYTWECHTGTVEVIDQEWQLVCIIPQDESESWRWINLSLVEVLTNDPHLNNMNSP